MNKKILLIILILAIFTISAVNATEDVNLTNDEIATDGDIVENVILSETQDNEIVSADDIGTFSDLKKLIDDSDDGIVNLDKDYKFDSLKDVSYVSGIYLSEDLTIDGNNHVIDADGKARIFNIDESNIILKNIIFKNGYQDTNNALGSSGSSNGGAINGEDSSLEIINSTFINNFAGKNGGAIYLNNWEGNLKISDSTFTNNKASLGGAIFAFLLTSDLIIDNTKFDENSVSGGSIEIYTGGNLKISNSNFTNGGQSIQITDAKPEFSNNILSSNDYIDIRVGSILSKTKIIVLDNKSQETVDELTAVITDDNGNKIITDDDLGTLYFVLEDGTKIKATQDNKGIWSADYSSFEEGKNYIISATFDGEVLNDVDVLTAIVGSVEEETTQNPITGETGTFSELQTLINENTNSIINIDKDYIYNETTDSTLTKGIIINNDGLTINGNNHILDAKGEIRIFDIEASDVTIKDLIFINGNQKSESTNSNNLGGAIYVAYKNVEIINSTFINNTAKANGGAIYARSSDNFQVINSKFVGNKGTGIIYLTGVNNQIINSTFVGATNTALYTNGDKTKVIKSTFINSTASSGGAINIQSTNAEVINSTFINSVSSGNGGAINIQGDNALIINSTFVNSSAKNGGAISTKYSTKIYNSTFTNSKATGYGGVIHADGSSNVKEFIIYNSTFINSQALSSHGGVLYYLSNYEGYVINSTFINSTSKTWGGALYFQTGGTIAHVTGSTFINTSSGTFGGALYLPNANAQIDNNTFINSNSNEGGAIYIGASGSTLSNLILINNNATNGGAIFITGGKETRLINISASGNNASYGGVLYVASSEDVNIYDSTFANNTATRGGAVYWTSNYAEIYDSVFDGNNADLGGAIYWSGLYDESVRNNFTNNKAENGGAIYWSGSQNSQNDDGYITESNFINNTALNGGAVYWTGGYSPDYSISKSNFTNNTAELDGGALYLTRTWVDSEVTISNFEGNKALNGKGGAIYIDGESYDSRITSSNFTKNTALNDNGGAIYLDGITHPSSKNIFTISGLIFNENEAVDGAAIYWYDGTDGTLSYSVFNDNKASNGAVVNIDTIKDSLTISDSIFNGDNKLAITTSDKLNLNNNTLNDDNYIYLNSKALTSDINIIVLENKTLEDTIILKAVITDDNNNTIILSDSFKKLQFILPNGDKVEATQDNLGVWTAEHLFDNEGTYVISATHDDFAKINVFNAEIIITHALHNSNLNIEDIEIDYLDDANIIITLEDDASGNIIVSLNGEEIETITLTDSNKASISVPVSNLNAGVYTVSAVYGGDDYYAGTSAHAVLTVNKIDPTLEINIEDLNQKIIVTATLTSDATGQVSIIINNKTYNTNPVTIDEIEIITYEINVTYDGDNNYNAFENTTEYKVVKRTSEITITATTPIIGQNTIITVTVSDGATGTVDVKVNGTDYQIDLSGDKTLSIPLTNAGEYIINATYLGDSRFEGSVSENKIINVVDKITPTTTISGVSNEVESATLITIEVSTDGFNPILTINGKEYEIVDGKVEFLPSSSGSYTIILTTDENDTYWASSVTKTFTVVKSGNLLNPTIEITPVSDDIHVGDKVLISVDVETDGEVLITVNGETIENNTNFTVSHEGSYFIYVETTETNKYDKGTGSLTFKASKKDLKVTVNQFEAVNGENEITVSVSEPATGIVDVTVNGISYSIDLSKGSSVKVPLSAGTYTINATYRADDNYNKAVSENIIVTVKDNNDGTDPNSPSQNGTSGNSNTTIINNTVVINPTGIVSLKSNKNIVVFYNSGDAYKVRVYVDGKAVGANKKVSITFNGKTKTVKTDANGWVSFKVATNGIKPGSYTIIAKYGDVSVANSVKIKSVISAKKTTKVKRTAKSFKVKITLKGKKVLKKQNVKVKFKGKTYNLKTNNKGVATFKVTKKIIKKLKKGKTYSYTITYGKNTLKRFVKIR